MEKTLFEHQWLVQHCQKMIVYNTELLQQNGQDPTALKWKSFWEDQLATAQKKLDSFLTSTPTTEQEALAKPETSRRWLNRGTLPTESQKKSSQSTMPQPTQSYGEPPWWSAKTV